MSRILGVVALALVLPGQSENGLTRFLPRDTPVVVELIDGAACLQRLFDLLQPLPKGVPPSARLFLMGLPLATKAKTGRDLRDLLEVLTPGHVALALFPRAGAAPFPVLLSSVDEVDEARRILKRLKGSPFHARIDDGVLTMSNRAEHLRTAMAFPKEPA